MMCHFTPMAPIFIFSIRWMLEAHIVWRPELHEEGKKAITGCCAVLDGIISRLIANIVNSGF